MGLGGAAPAAEAPVLRRVRPHDGDGGRHPVPEGHLALSPRFHHNALHLTTNQPIERATSHRRTYRSANESESKQQTTPSCRLTPTRAIRRRLPARAKLTKSESEAHHPHRHSCRTTATPVPYCCSAAAVYQVCDKRTPLLLISLPHAARVLREQNSTKTWSFAYMGPILTTKNVFFANLVMYVSRIVTMKKKRHKKTRIFYSVTIRYE